MFSGFYITILNIARNFMVNAGQKNLIEKNKMKDILVKIIQELENVMMLSIFVCICVIERSALLEEGRIYLYIWAVATCMGVVVTVSWDLRMDWGLLKGNGLLKDELVYSQQVS